MGWHQGADWLLAVWAVCTFTEGLESCRVACRGRLDGDAAATIGSASLRPRCLPSPAGVACFDPSNGGHVRVSDWTGNPERNARDSCRRHGALTMPATACGGQAAGGPGDPSPKTTMLSVDGSGVVTTPGHMGCMWMDDGHVLAPDAVIAYPSGMPSLSAQTAQCAGRFRFSLTGILGKPVLID